MATDQLKDNSLRIEFSLTKGKAHKDKGAEPMERNLPRL